MKKWRPKIEDKNFHIYLGFGNKDFISQENPILADENMRERLENEGNWYLRATVTERGHSNKSFCKKRFSGVYLLTNIPTDEPLESFYYFYTFFFEEYRLLKERSFLFV